MCVRCGEASETEAEFFDFVQKALFIRRNTSNLNFIKSENLCSMDIRVQRVKIQAIVCENLFVPVFPLQRQKYLLRNSFKKVGFDFL